MSPDEIQIAKASMEQLLKPFSNLVERLFGAATDQLGGTLGDAITVYRFKRKLQLLKRVQEMIDDAHLEAKKVPLKLLHPIFEQASLEEDDTLQDRWAALLANAATVSVNELVLPAFPDILRQLRPVDAQFFDTLYRRAEVRQAENQDFAGKPLFLTPIGNVLAIAGLYDQMRGDRLRGLSPERLDDFFATVAELDNFSTTRATLVSLGLIEERGDTVAVYGAIGGLDLDYYLTPIGCRFYLACQPPANKV